VCTRPILDGFGATRRIRALGHEIRQPFICALTANAMEGDARQCVDAGMNAYLSKPVLFSNLCTALKQGYTFLHAQP
jgi:CheY-like chemotaxis protein